jgi:hypothetical protein
LKPPPEKPARNQNEDKQRGEQESHGETQKAARQKEENRERRDAENGNSDGDFHKGQSSISGFLSSVTGIQGRAENLKLETVYCFLL